MKLFTLLVVIVLALAKPTMIMDGEVTAKHVGNKRQLATGGDTCVTVSPHEFFTLRGDCEPVMGKEGLGYCTQDCCKTVSTEETLELSVPGMCVTKSCLDDGTPAAEVCNDVDIFNFPPAYHTMGCTGVAENGGSSGFKFFTKLCCMEPTKPEVVFTSKTLVCKQVSCHCPVVTCEDYLTPPNANECAPGTTQIVNPSDTNCDGSDINCQSKCCIVPPGCTNKEGETGVCVSKTCNPNCDNYCEGLAGMFERKNCNNGGTSTTDCGKGRRCCSCQPSASDAPQAPPRFPDGAVSQFPGDVVTVVSQAPDGVVTVVSQAQAPDDVVTVVSQASDDVVAVVSQTPDGDGVAPQAPVRPVIDTYDDR